MSVRRWDGRAGRPDLTPAAAVLRVGAVLLRRPALWPSVARFLPSRWWHRWPPRPWPSGEYMRFRTETMYGGAPDVDPADVVRYLEWCRRMAHPAR